MVTNTALKLRDEGGALSEEDNGTAFSLSGKTLNPLVYQAAQKLIDRHKAGSPIYVEAFDVPHEALVTISERLEELGISQSIADIFVGALKNYILSNGGSFARTVNAKPIFIVAEVADTMPDFRFESGITEMAAIDEKSATTEGVSKVELHSTITGTKMTSNRANIDKIFTNVKGYKLWVRFEAPTHDEVNGFLTQQQVALTAIGETIGSAVSAAELKELLVQMKQDDLVTPKITLLLKNLIEMRSLIEAKSTPENQIRIKELSIAIIEQLTGALKDVTLPLPLIQGAAQSLTLLSNTPGLTGVVPAKVLQGLQVKVRAVGLVKKLEGVANALNPDSDKPAIAEIKAIIARVSALEGKELLKALAEIPVQLAALNLPETHAEQITSVKADIETLKEHIEALTTSVSAINISEMEAKDTLKLLQMIQSLDPPPTELKSLLVRLEQANIDIKNISPEQIVAALSGKGETVLAEVVQDMVIALNDPKIQAALPQAESNSVKAIMSERAPLVEAITIQGVIRGINTAIENGNLTPLQTAALKEIITSLETGEGLKGIEPSALKTIFERLELPASLEKIVLSIENAQIASAASAVEASGKILTAANDLQTAKTAFAAERNSEPRQINIASNPEKTNETLKVVLDNVKVVVESISTTGNKVSAPVAAAQKEELIISNNAPLIPASMHSAEQTQGSPQSTTPASSPSQEPVERLATMLVQTMATEASIANSSQPLPTAPDTVKLNQPTLDISAETLKPANIVQENPQPLPILESKPVEPLAAQSIEQSAQNMAPTTDMPPPVAPADVSVQPVAQTTNTPVEANIQSPPAETTTQEFLEPKIADTQATGLQYNSDGTLKDCCKNAFQDAAALQEKLTVQVDSSPELKSQLQSLQHIAADGTVSAVTAQQLAENAVAHEAIHTGPMQDMRGNSIAISEATQKNWSDDTLKLLKASEAQEDKMNHQFNSANKQ